MRVTVEDASIEVDADARVSLQQQGDAVEPLQVVDTTLHARARDFVFDNGCRTENGSGTDRPRAPAEVGVLSVGIAEGFVEAAEPLQEVAPEGDVACLIKTRLAGDRHGSNRSPIRLVVLPRDGAAHHDVGVSESRQELTQPIASADTVVGCESDDRRRAAAPAGIAGACPAGV